MFEKGNFIVSMAFILFYSIVYSVLFYCYYFVVATAAAAVAAAGVAFVVAAAAAISLLRFDHYRFPYVRININQLYRIIIVYRIPYKIAAVAVAAAACIRIVIAVVAVAVSVAIIVP